MSNARLFIVEDEGIIAMDLQLQLEDFGYEVVGAAVTGQQALEGISATRPDLIMMDIMISGDMDGIATAEMVRQQFRTPVIFLSAYSDETTLRRAKAAAPYGYLVKPFRPEELRTTIEVALVKHGMEVRLRESEQWFAKTLHCISDAIVATDEQGMVRFVNPAAESLTGWNNGSAAGQPVSEVFHVLDEHTREPMPNPALCALQEQHVIGLESGALMVSNDGREIPIEDGAAPILSDDGRLMGAVLVFRDIGKRRQIERALRESVERFHSAFDHAAIGMALVAIEGGILQVNRAIGDILGYSTPELLRESFPSLIHTRERSLYTDNMRRLDAGELPSFQIEVRLRSKCGELVWVQLSTSLVRDDSAAALYSIVQLQDIHARRSAEERLVYLARHDAATGLVNRAQLGELLTQALNTAQRRRESLAVLFVDLDGFKLVNDTLGHTAGDELLQVLAQRLCAVVRTSDVVGRWGGDEFVVVADDVRTEEHAAQIAQKIITTVAEPVQLGGQGTITTVSIGVALFPRDGNTAEALLVSADSAMYRAKELGKNQYQLATEEATSNTLQHMRLEHDLHRALVGNEFSLHYQPILEHGRIGAVEALIRWQHPDLGTIPPLDFIPLAEKAGLIVPIGAWVLRTACAQLQRWRAAGHGRLRVAVNLSARQFRDPDLIASIAATLAETRLPASALEIEITESSIMANPPAVIGILNELKEMGVKLTVDDFGTGYSSLSYLKRFPLHRLKIDRSFVSDVPGDANGEAIIRAIIGLARTLNLAVVAEGVENREQREFLDRLCCDALQGYGLYRPAPAEEIDAILSQSTLPLQPDDVEHHA